MRRTFVFGLLAVLIASSCASAATAAPLPRKPTSIAPAEYDRAYKGGKLTIVTVATRAELLAACPSLTSPTLLACSRHHPGYGGADAYCRITILQDSVLKARGYSRELVLRHEYGHCNGWSADHPGARRI